MADDQTDTKPEKLPVRPIKSGPYKRNRQDLMRLADMVELGASKALMASRLGIGPSVLEKLYGRELIELGQQRSNAHVPNDITRAKVKLMAGLGLLKSHISTVLGISSQKLRELYAHELESGAPELHAKAGANLVRISSGSGPEAVNALKFILSRRFGWVDKSHVEMTGPDGQPLVNETRIVIMLPPNGRESAPPTIEHDAAD